jgi:ribulose-5-phosphate 4-epimerase/fuculose-1-phosphate aldolase
MTHIRPVQVLTQDPADLFGISPWLDRSLRDMGHYAAANRDFHVAAQGDDSLLLPTDVGRVLVERFEQTATSWYYLSEIHTMADIRADGRRDYNGSGCSEPRLYEHGSRLAGRVLLITATGAYLPMIQAYNDEGIGGKCITAIEVSSNGKAIRVLYGHTEWGTLPSSETLMHLISAALLVQEGYDSGSTVHCHPFPLVMLAQHPRVNHDEQRFNAALLTRIQSMLYHGSKSFTVKLVPYEDPGSQALVKRNLDAMPDSPFILWGNHGTIVRGRDIHSAYAATASASRAAEAALLSLERGYLGFPMTGGLRTMLQKHGLYESYQQLYGDPVIVYSTD